MKAAREAASAVHRVVGKKLDSDWRGRVEVAFVRQFHPLRVELQSSVVLDENDELHVSQFLNWWRVQFGLKIDDQILCAQVQEGVWVAFDVRQPQTATAGVRPGAGAGGDGGYETAAPAATEAGLFSLGSVAMLGDTPSLTWHHHIVKKLPVYDEAGAVVGWVPVFGDLP